MENNIPTEAIEINGKEPGKTSIILVGVHGNEEGGVEAMNKILPNLSIENGRVIICYANPKAISQKTRYTEANLNRMFLDETDISPDDRKSYEFNRALYLKKYLLESDVLLDIHASNNPNSKPFVICESNAEQIVKYLPVGTVVNGFDTIEPGGADYFMNRNGKVGACIECGYLGDDKSTKIAEESIYAFLKTQGHIPGHVPEHKQSYIQMYELYKSKTNQFILTSKFKDFEYITKDQLIGIDGNEKIFAKEDSIILFAKDTAKVGQEVFLLGKIKQLANKIQ